MLFFMVFKLLGIYERGEIKNSIVIFFVFILIYKL